MSPRRNVRDWFEKHSGNFQRMIFPPRSADMNPIEHMWNRIERAIRAQDPPPSYERQSRLYGFTSLQRTTSDLSRPCHVELLHCAVYEGRPTRYKVGIP